MAYNKLEKLQENAEAIHIALQWKPGVELSEDALAKLRRFAGFGGIKAVLMDPGDKDAWAEGKATREDLKLAGPLREFHTMLRESLNDAEYAKAVDSLKNSVMTAFYTPPAVPDAVFACLHGLGIDIRRMYEPSSGAGVFIDQALGHYPGLEAITAVEKDLLTSMVLTALGAHLSPAVTVVNKGFEVTSVKDNGSYDLIASNIPFGNFRVYDPAFPQQGLSGSIHNYFFAKGLDKIREGGLLAYITSDGFLNSPANREAREYLFSRADFVHVSVMPDNLMKETGNTEAPSHLLVVQKNTDKAGLSEEERLLLETVQKENEFGYFAVNAYAERHPELWLGDEVGAGKNQYGNAHQTVWQNGPLSETGQRLRGLLDSDFQVRFNKPLFNERLENNSAEKDTKLPKLTLLPQPAVVHAPTVAQGGLFDAAPTESANRASAYLTEKDALSMARETARLVAVIKTAERPDHEAVVMVAAKSKASKAYHYKFFSNAAEIRDIHRDWLAGSDVAPYIQAVAARLRQFNHDYVFTGDKTFEAGFGLKNTAPEHFLGLKPFYKNGVLVMLHGRPGLLSDVDKENDQAVFTGLDSGEKDKEFFDRYARVRDEYFRLFDLEAKEGVAYQGLRLQLNELYDEFVGAHGTLNAPLNAKRVREDRAFGTMMLNSLERPENGAYVKADFLLSALAASREPFRTEVPAEALAVSLNDKGTVDMAYVAEMLNQTEDEAVASLGELVYLNPSSRQWEPRDSYLSGNVVLKLAAAEQATETSPGDAQVQRSLAAIRAVQPEAIPFELLNFNLGERWIPVDYYSRFVSELFGLDATVTYFASLDSFKVACGNNAKTDGEFAISPRSGQKMYGAVLLENALENTAPYFTYEVENAAGSTSRLPDTEAIQLAQQKIEAVRTQFGEWMLGLPAEDKAGITELYNKTYNCFVLREYNGDHLNFPGLDKERLGIPDLYGSQKSAVWRIVQNRGALIDHEVGLGKTLIMIGAAMEMKRLGIARKPAILALKSTVTQIRDAFRQAYPKARVLAPDEDDFSPARRLKLFYTIKNNNWDCVIITHDQFGKIPQSLAAQERILSGELGHLEADLKTAKDLGGDVSKRVLKGLEVRKNNLSAKLKSVFDAIEQKKDEEVNFQELGIDHLFVDESHKFKNLTFTTRHNRVAGLGNPDGSEKALNMLFAVRTLQEKFDADLCATFLSGTPISNSLTEEYTLLKYLSPRELARQRIENFDGWAAVFAKKTVDFEFSVTNQIIQKERFRHFKNVPELAMLYNRITDYKTAKHTALDRPELEEHLVNIHPTPWQQEFIKNLVMFAQTCDATLLGRAPLTRGEETGIMLMATHYAKMTALDGRLFDPGCPDHPDNKVNVCARNVADIYHQSSVHRGTQIVFSDMGTPKKDEFNVYDALKEKLTRDFGIPPAEITFIHDWEGPKKKELFRKMNRGEIRVLVGSTEKAGTGNNVQRRVVAMHHLDIPWRPSDLDQRNGRGARPGNLVAKEFYGNKVKSFIYAVEQTLDLYKFNTLKNKQTFISQMKNSSLQVRTIDEGALDEQGGMNFSEYIAILSGDTSLLEKSKLEKQVTVLESLRGAHYRDTSRSKWDLEYAEKKLASDIRVLEDLTSDALHISQAMRYDKEGTKLNPLQLDGVAALDPEAAGRHIIGLFLYSKPADGRSEEKKVGTLYGFELFVKSRYDIASKTLDFPFVNELYAQRPGSNVKYTLNGGSPNVDNAQYSARYFLHAIGRNGNLVEKHRADIAAAEKNIPVLRQVASKPFEREEELKTLKTSLATLERKIAVALQENNMRQQGLVAGGGEAGQGKEHLKAVKADGNPGAKDKGAKIEPINERPLRRAR